VRFAPFDFFDVPSFPNVVPIMDEWGDCLPRFRGKDEYCHAHHLIKFHQCMDHLDLHHEDVLMKMFMYLLEGDARQWYRALPSSSISSLKEFHATFNKHCRRYFPIVSLFENCCEEFETYIQHAKGFAYDCEDERDVTDKGMEEESHESFSNSSIQEEDLQDNVEDRVDDN
jgi:hypothetical protein